LRAYQRTLHTFKNVLKQILDQICLETMRYFWKKATEEYCFVRTGIWGALTHIAVIKKKPFKEKFKTKYA